ncbi:putative uncharacterized protein DDB_G0290521 [Penaeus japonicus]|uniref:putative uncharacterized protein DDB_G0290521 n=1 Tax=Penaeus japonicus TaxID=27405 RepID=UPI001C70D818|nr:putative uncharacterized protein DDB_G0290521 [Penaeus japonicus]
MTYTDRTVVLFHPQTKAFPSPTPTPTTSPTPTPSTIPTPTSSRLRKTPSSRHKSHTRTAPSCTGDWEEESRVLVASEEEFQGLVEPPQLPSVQDRHRTQPNRTFLTTRDGRLSRPTSCEVLLEAPNARPKRRLPWRMTSRKRKLSNPREPPEPVTSQPSPACMRLLTRTEKVLQFSPTPFSLREFTFLAEAHSGHSEAAAHARGTRGREGPTPPSLVELLTPLKDEED